MINRTLEEELMLDPEQSRAYALADFSDVNEGFVEKFTALFPDVTKGTFIDIGCGPCDIVYRLLGKLIDVYVVAVDGSKPMLNLAERDGRHEKHSNRIELQCFLLKELAGDGRMYNAVLSNSLLHHLPDPSLLWSAVKKISLPGAAVMVMDLFRPESEEAARDIVERNAVDESPILKHDFYMSLLAAFTKEEVEGQLKSHALQNLKVEIVSERHLLVWGRL